MHDALRSRSISNPDEGQECSRTRSVLSVTTLHDQHSFFVPFGSIATQFVPSRSQLYSSIRWNVPHTASARCREFGQSFGVEIFDGYEVVFLSVVVRELLQIVAVLSLQGWRVAGPRRPVDCASSTSRVPSARNCVVSVSTAYFFVRSRPSTAVLSLP